MLVLCLSGSWNAGEESSRLISSNLDSDRQCLAFPTSSPSPSFWVKNRGPYEGDHCRIIQLHLTVGNLSFIVDQHASP